MANPGKFVSVNLNKSYGQRRNSASSSSSAFGNGRARPSALSVSGGGGMVVLSRPRSSSSVGNKATPRLSVPPPLNLPSLRKEHERSDPSSTSGSTARPGSSGVGAGTGSSTVGWTKPAAFQDKDSGAGVQTASVGSPYMPPGSRSVPQPVTSSPGRAFPIAEKAVVLRGEDFPSLLATTQKQKDALNRKQKDKQAGEEYSDWRTEKPELQSPLHMRPQLRSSRLTTSSLSDGDGGLSRSVGSPELSRKQDRNLPGPLPLVRLAHNSDWADDERDTALSIHVRDRDRGFSRTESFRVHDLSDGRVPRDVEAGNVPSREFFRGDSFGRELSAPNKGGRDASSWRLQMQPRDGFSSPDIGVDKDRVGPRSLSMNREMSKENNNSQLPYANSGREGYSSGTQNSWFSRRDMGYGMNIQNGKNRAEVSNGRGAEQNMRGRFGDLSSNRYKGDTFQNSMIPKVPFSSGNKASSLNDPILNLGREKWLTSNSGKPYHEYADFDSRDPFSDSLVGDVSVKVFKRKKDMLKYAEFHDPVRESFEAELERVQRMQEQERQRVIEEQERALELARKEEEERERLVREEEERRRLLEEEGREAAWRAEQERLEAARRAEEQKIAREEEKRRTLMEEERRKEAARQKLLELEARIARRKAETDTMDDRLHTALGDERAIGTIKGGSVPRVADIGDWEDGERVVERVTNAFSSDSSNINRFFDTDSRPQSSRDGNSSNTERGKHANYWKRDAYDNGNNSTFVLQDQENGYRGTRRDAFGSERNFPRRELHGSLGAMPGRPSFKGGIPGTSQMPDDFHHLRGQRWNAADGDNFNRNSDVDGEFLDNDKFADVGWGPGRFRGTPHAPYAERLFQNPEVDGFSLYGRSRHSLRQPRVLPPPSMSSMYKNSSTAGTEHPSSSSFLDSKTRYQHSEQNEEQYMRTGYDSGYQEKLQHPGTSAVTGGNAEQKEENTSLRCDSQSSLSVSSPPSSPTHLSHDDLDDSRDCAALPASADGERTVSSDEHIQSSLEVGNPNIMTPLSSASTGEDDEWAIENNDEMQEQEEYDEEDDGYEEEDEPHEGDDENLDLVQEYEDLQSDVQTTTGEVNQLVLGFDDGIEVRIPSNDEFERTSGNSEKEIGLHTSLVASEQEQISYGGHNLQTENTSPKGTVNNSSKIVDETEKVLHDLVIEPIATPGHPSNSVGASSSSGMPAQQPVTSTINLPVPSISSAQPSLSSDSTVATQSEVPVKLQFGLFSGPSLIPSPVPAIQIGSIQMPLHLHSQVSPSLTQMHPSQPTFFQFGQLRYTSPISQGILPLAPQTMPFVQAPSSAQHTLNQNPRGSLHYAPTLDFSTQKNSRDKVPSVPTDNQPAPVPKLFGLSQENVDCKELNAKVGFPRNEVSESHSQTVNSSFGNSKTRFDSASQEESYGLHDATVKNNRPMANNKESQARLHTKSVSSQFFSEEKTPIGSKVTGMIAGSRGKRFNYSVKNTGSRSSFLGFETSHTDSSGFQRRPRRNIRRTEFRVRENVDNRRTEGIESSNFSGQDEKPNFYGRVPGISARNVGKKDAGLYKSTKMTMESENLNSGASSSPVVSSDGKLDKALAKEAAPKRHMSSVKNSRTGEGNIKKNGSPEEDVDAPLQSGVVRVFKQPGIEAPSDEDDFIEVRSKRQMLNDRREQREKEIKAKSRVVKAPRKHLPDPQSNAIPSSSDRAVASFGGDTTNSVSSDTVVLNGKGCVNVEPSSVFTANMTSQILPPIGTPAANVDPRPNSFMSTQTSSAPVISSAGMKLVPCLSLENQSVALASVSTPLGSWGAHINQQVMALTQTQLDEAMKPARFDSHMGSSIVLQSNKLSISSITPEKPSSSSASPLNSLLAGEKIQFGAVTSPTILPVSRAFSNGIRPPSSRRSDVSINCNLPGTDNNCTMCFDKEKRLDEPCAHLEDPESEAEAAASAVAVAAISNDEIVGNGLGAISVSVSDSKSFGGAGAGELTLGGVATNRELTGQSAGEESLAAALPADLSVDTPSLSLWPPIMSPQSSSGPMISHFPGPPPSHFPCFEMKHMLGGPIFAFGPHDESAGTQVHPPRSTTLGSGPLGPWPQCHSSVDSFYGPPAGFAGPFISPGGIAGVQGPPHMLVYNPFAPVGQFGQVGLGFMGTTYIPTGKQPDWKHNPGSSSVGVSEGDISNLNVVSGQLNPPNIPAIQHLAPGSPLMQMASPLAMFDMPPFQSSSEIPVQARWSHIPASPLHPVPLSVPLQQHQLEGGMHSQFSHSIQVENSSRNSRFHELRSSIPGDGSRNFSVPSNAVSQFPDELILVEPTSSSGTVQTSRPSYSPASGSNNSGPDDTKNPVRCSVATNVSESGGIETSSSSNSGQSMGPSFKPQSPQQPTSSGQYIHPIGYSDQRGGASQKLGSGGDWNRRMGFQGRNQTLGADKSFGSSKMKQIYVAKQSTRGPEALV